MRVRAAGALLLASVLVLVSCDAQMFPGDFATGPATPGRSAPDRTTVPATSAPTSSVPAPRPTTPHTKSPAQVRAEVDTAVRKLARGQPAGSISLAALNTATGARYSFGATHGMWTASAYKLLVLEGLLLQHQRNGTWLSAAQVDAAVRAIENSDNAAGYRLFLDLGGRAALTDAIHRLAMTHTVAGHSDPTFTTTSGADCLKMLAALRPGGKLNARSRTFVLRLMSKVEADQRWGVGVLAGSHGSFVNKNGWLSIENNNGPGENDDGRWAVTSVGIVTAGGQQILLAVLTQHQPDFATGKRLVEALTRAIAPVVR